MDGEQRKTLIVELLGDVFAWARATQRTQPVTSGICPSTAIVGSGSMTAKSSIVAGSRGRALDPELSVVIPTRDRWDLLRQAVASALDQENVELEDVVIGDASLPLRLARHTH